MPANAGIQKCKVRAFRLWVPAFAGTSGNCGPCVPDARNEVAMELVNASCAWLLVPPLAHSAALALGSPG
jgi:hypothetical protein